MVVVERMAGSSSDVVDEHCYLHQRNTKVVLNNFATKTQTQEETQRRNKRKATFFLRAPLILCAFVATALNYEPSSNT